MGGSIMKKTKRDHLNSVERFSSSLVLEVTLSEGVIKSLFLHYSIYSLCACVCVSVVCSLCAKGGKATCLLHHVI